MHVFAEAVAQEAAAGGRDRLGAAAKGDALTKRKDLKRRFMAAPKFREEYARGDGEYARIEALVPRTAAKLTQAAARGFGADG